MPRGKNDPDRLAGLLLTAIRKCPKKFSVENLREQLDILGVELKDFSAIKQLLGSDLVDEGNGLFRFDLESVLLRSGIQKKCP